MFQRLFEIAKQLLAESDVDKLLSLAMDQAIQISGAERGLIVLFGEQGENLFETARNLNKEDISKPEFEISHTIIRRVRQEGQPLCLRNALDEPSLQNSDSIARLKILSVICLPLKQADKIFGVVYLDNRTVRGVFKKETFDFVRQFADFISLAAYRALECKQLHNQVQSLEEELRAKYQFGFIVGHHPKVVEILKLMAKVADTDAMVLIQGESGTGKELVARALHFNHTIRKEKNFVPVNCGAIPESLQESELFGYKKGAFTGSGSDKIGFFEHADSGTIFLDEISEMSPAMQVKLLRVLQTGEYYRLGESAARYCSVRVIAATNQNLQELVQCGKFREDLYYRLKVIDLVLPPLRERKMDISLLALHFLRLYEIKFGKKGLRLSREAENALLAYHFPGNVRELENIIQRAVLLTDGHVIEPAHLPGELIPNHAKATGKPMLSSYKIAKQHAIGQFDPNYFSDCLTVTGGNITRAAKMAGINVKNFYSKLKKYGLDPHAFKFKTK